MASRGIRHISLRLGFASLVAILSVVHFDRAYAGELRIGIIGDQTLADKCCDPYLKLSKAVTLLNQQDVKGVLHTGDLVESETPGETIAEYDAAFARATKLLDGLRSPWYLTPGDHDVDPADFAPNSSDRTFEGELRRLYGKRQPLAAKHLYYSFDIESYHFIALDSVEHLDVDPRWGDVYLAQLGEEQQRWLLEDLQKHKNSSAIVVFMHQPLWYNWTAWSKVHQLLKRFPVKAVIAGHFHYAQDEGELDGIRYIVVGATGAKVKAGNEQSGNVHQVTVVTLSNGRASFRLLNVDTGKEMTMMLRSEMDRVQALDVLLGELGSFSEQNPLCLDNGKLYAGKKHSPARLRLIPLGNPIDVPIEVAIEFRNSEIALAHAQFNPKACLIVTADNHCFLSPAARISYANDSVVQLNSACGAFGSSCSCGTGCVPMEPLWESDLTQPATSKIPPGSLIQLTVTMAFRSEGRVFSLHKAAQATVAASCQ